MSSVIEKNKYTYIFMYSHLNQAFESKIVLFSNKLINYFLLRARLNSQRDIKIYSVLLSDSDYIYLQNKLDNQVLKESCIFKELQSREIKEIPW